jgi:hypothetical protein
MLEIKPQDKGFISVGVWGAASSEMIADGTRVSLCLKFLGGRPEKELPIKSSSPGR